MVFRAVFQVRTAARRFKSVYLELKPNVGDVDRAIRAVAGIAMIGIAQSEMVSPRWAATLGILGTLKLVEAALGYCVLYDVMDISTL